MKTRILFLILFLVSNVFSTVHQSPRKSARAISSGTTWPIAVSELESPRPARTSGIHFPQFISSGKIVGNSTLSFATAYNSRSIAQGIDRTLHLVWCTLNESGYCVQYSRSRDRGETWTPPVEIQDGIYGYKPTVAVDPNAPELVYIAWAGYQTAGESRAIRVAKSTDAGETWGTSVLATGSNRDANNPFLAVDSRGWLHLAFDNYTDRCTRYTFSADHDQTWLPEPVVVSAQMPPSSFSSTLAVDQNNNVHIVFGNGGDAGAWGDKGIYWTSLEMQNAIPGQTPALSQLPPLQLAEPGLGLPYPALVFDSQNIGHLWYDNRNADGNRAVFYRKYAAGIWSAPESVPACCPDGANLGASCAIDAQDNLFVVFHDHLDGEFGWNWDEWPVDLFVGTNFNGRWLYENVTADGYRNQQYADCPAWVAGDSLLHLVYTAGTAPEYQIVHEIGFPWSFTPPSRLSSLPDTYNPTGPFPIQFLPGTPVVMIECSLQVWKNGIQLPDRAMTRVSANEFVHDLVLPGAPGDRISYTVQVRFGAESRVHSPLQEFQILAPENPTAKILLVGNDLDFVRPFFSKLLAQILGLTNPGTEYWDLAQHRGIDSSVVNFGWSTIFLCPYFQRDIPVREYDQNPFAGFLNAGAPLSPHFLCIFNDEYFYINDEPAWPDSLSFAPGDFAFDFLGLQSAVSDPGENADSVLWGIASNPISGDFVAQPIRLNFRQRPIKNWSDWTKASDAARDLFTVETPGRFAGVSHDQDHFRTVFLPWNFQALMTDSTDWPDGDSAAVRLMQRILEWFGHKTNSGTPWHPEIENFRLAQNYPNPFNPATRIHFSLPRAGWVKLQVFNHLGQRVHELINANLPGGDHSVTWNGVDAAGQPVASGIYYYRLRAGEFEYTRKMLLLR